MKKLSTLIFLLVLCAHIFATEWVKINSDSPQKANVELNFSTVEQSVFSFHLDGFYTRLVTTEKGDAWQVYLDNSAPSIIEGAPELPVFATSLIIPDQAEMKLNVVSAEFTEFEDVLILPSKGNLTRDINPDDVPFTFGKYYGIDAFYPGETGKLGAPYIVRDYRGQAIQIQPFQYNPITKILRVYHHIEFELEVDGESAYNAFDRPDLPESIDSRFASLYNRQFLNYQSSQRYDPVEEEGGMIIISHADFLEEIQAFADWKIMTGMPVEVVDVAEIGGATDIKEYIQNAYDEGGLTYVLLVGDAAQVPTSESQGNDSDVEYSYLAGDDHYPDLFVGRFSAETEDHVITMVSRTLEYEQNPSSDTAWYTKAIGLGSNEGPGDDGEMDYEHLRNIADNKLIPFTYDYAYEFFAGSQGGNDDDGNPSASAVASAINTGVSIINYTGHGSTVSWGTSGFNNGDIEGLTNTGMWPFIISVACVNGNFVNNTCFGETWIRAEDEGQPTGAIATIMSTINQSWNPPMRGQDEMNDILTEAHEENIKRTFGGITMNGCMNMNDVYGQGGYSETDCWTIFGDPSVMVRTAVPADMTVSHPAGLPLGSTSFTVSSDAEGGLAALTMDGEIIGTAIVEGGAATITFEALSVPGEATVVVTAFNYRPSITTLNVVAADGPYLVMASVSMNDQNGNDNGQADYAESEIFLTVGISNIGTEQATSVLVDIVAESEFVNITADQIDYGHIAAGDTVYVTDAFEMAVADSVPDNEILSFNVTATDEAEDNWMMHFNMEGHAPVLSQLSFLISDPDGNNDQLLDPGETADILVTAANLGSSEAYNVVAQLLSQSDYLTIISESQTGGNLAPGAEVEFSFKVTAAADAPDGMFAEMNLEMIADHNIKGGGTFGTYIGKKPVLVIDLASNSKSVDTIAACMNMLQVEAEFAAEIPDDLLTYRSVFVLLGIYPDNYQLTEEEGLKLAEFLDNGGCIYMEGGDTWAYDDATAVHEYFRIIGESDGNSDLGEVYGDEDGFLSWFTFVYEGNNNFIDRITPATDAVMLLNNVEPAYGVAVSYEGEGYKTIGATFDFSGLQDGAESSKDEMIAEILGFFDIGYTWTATEQFYAADYDVSIYPNPFSTEVNFEITLTKDEMVSVDIFDLTGRVISQISEESYRSGKVQVSWDPASNAGERVEPGIYFARIAIGNKTITKKLIFSN